MTFARSLRTARDTSLPLNQRVNGLKGCVRHYKPLGFQATLDFVESQVGRFTVETLPDALDLLCVSRDAWQAELRAYGVMRRHAKRMGQRVPHPLAPNPNTATRWYGASREAAVHAMWFWHRRRASADVIGGMALLIDAGEYDQMRQLLREARSTAP